MTGYSGASSIVTGGGAVRWAIDETRGAHFARSLRWRETRRTCAATALAALLVAGASVPVLAQNPAPNEVWGGCVLTDDTDDFVTDAVAGLVQSVERGTGIGTPEIAFVVVYSLNNDNDGQPVNGGFTGPVICRNKAVVDELETTTQTTDIGEVGDEVTILDAEEAFLLQYQFDNGPTDIEKRVCHTVNSNTDCFLIRPVPTD